MLIFDFEKKGTLLSLNVLCIIHSPRKFYIEKSYFERTLTKVRRSTNTILRTNSFFERFLFFIFSFFCFLPSQIVKKREDFLINIYFLTVQFLLPFIRTF